MQNSPRPQPRRRRRLTPAQRRRRWLRKNRKLLISCAALLLLLIILISVISGCSRKTPDIATQPANTPESISATETESGETSIDDSTDDTGSDISPVAENADSSDSFENDLAAAMANISVSDTSGVQSAAVSSGSFDYEEAYRQALNGVVTGPVITPDYSKVDPNYLSRWEMPSENRIPVLYTAQGVTDKVICITVDDCYQEENLRKIVACALEYGQSLTIFPIGQNMERENTAQIIKYAWEHGMEIENHTYTHQGLYHFNDVRMRQEIWYQARRLDQVLGVNYTEHFFRPHGGDERNDQRVQAFVNQLGMNAIALWTMSGSHASMSQLRNTLSPGNVYLFHTTDTDLDTLLQFIPYAVSQGYKLITMNEMYGLPANETSELTTTFDDPIPDFKSFKVDPVRLKKTSYCRASAVIQKRLIELGWLDGTEYAPSGDIEEMATGVFADASYMATGFFQLASGIKADGIADIETQKALFAADAQVGSKERIEELKRSIGK